MAPWRSTEDASKHFVLTIVRLRFNHNFFPQYLHKIVLADSPFCTCTDNDTVFHIIMEYSLYLEVWYKLSSVILIRKIKSAYEGTLMSITIYTLSLAPKILTYVHNSLFTID